MKIERPFKEDFNFERLRKVLMRETKEGHVPIFELYADAEIMTLATGIDFPAHRSVDLVNLEGEITPEILELAIKAIELSLAFSKAVGYDYVTLWPNLPLKRTGMSVSDVATQENLDDTKRAWHNEHSGLITSREEFNEYPWPTSVGPETLLPIELVAPQMPAGMKVMEMYTGIFEDLRNLMGFETMAYKSIEEPGLLEDVLDKLTDIAIADVDIAVTGSTVNVEMKIYEKYRYMHS